MSGSLAAQVTVQLPPRATSVALGVRLMITGGLLQPATASRARMTTTSTVSLIPLDFHILLPPLSGLDIAVWKSYAITLVKSMALE